MTVLLASGLSVKHLGVRFLYVLASLVLLASMLVFLPAKLFAAAEVITGATNKTGLTDEYISLGSLEITADGNPEVPVNIYVPFGELSMTLTEGLDFDSDQAGDELRFSGNLNDINAALATLRFRTTRAGTTPVSIWINSPDEVYYPGNGHMYEIVEADGGGEGGGVSWTEAKSLAEARTKNGASGYLVTVLNQEENDYISNRLDGDGWMGASDAETEGDWKWVTGPEAGMSFWSGLGDGSPVGGLFSNWASGEPNDAYESEEEGVENGENCAQFYSDGGWNDLHCSEHTLNYYVVEYGGPGNLPEVAAESFTVTTSFPAGATVEISDCNDLIAASTGSAVENRYDTITFTDDVDCEGETISPLYDDSDSYFGYMGFRGTVNGQGRTISDFVIDEDANVVGLFASTDGATISNLSITDATVDGDGCVGGLVGRSDATTITNVSVSADVSGWDDVGGIVGCMKAASGDAELTDSSSTGSVTTHDTSAGGVIGSAQSEGGYTLSITGNQTGSIITEDSGWGGHSIGGLIGYVGTASGGTVQIESNTSAGLIDTNANTVGGVIGSIESYAAGSSVYIEANQVSGAVSGRNYVGGQVGYVEVEEGGQVIVTDSHMAHDVSGEDGPVGGLVGDVFVEGASSDTRFHLTGSSVSGAVSGNYEVGGLVGRMGYDYGDEDMLVADSFTTGAVTSVDAGEGLGNGIGGLVGQGKLVQIVRSYATGTIFGYGGIGGLVGQADEVVVQESYATGSVTGEGWDIGGLVGYHAYSSISDSYARGNVTGEGNVGGLVGYNEGGGIRDSYATGTVSGSEDAGGLIGNNGWSEEDIINSFWDTQTSGTDDSDGGTGKSTAEMKQKSTFIADLDEPWNFASVWGMTTLVNDGYPCLVWSSGGCLPDDDDEDGIATGVEAAAPNGGDANGDGIQDSQQAHVASFKSAVNDQYVSVAVDDVCTLHSVGAAAEASKPVQDGGYSYPAGLVNFTAACGQDGYTTTVTLYFYGAGNGLTVRKFNPNTSVYFTVNGATQSAQTIGGQTATVVSYQITDGGSLDIDAAANGVIVDPVGLGVLGTGGPDTGTQTVRDLLFLWR